MLNLRYILLYNITKQNNYFSGILHTPATRELMMDTYINIYTDKRTKPLSDEQISVIYDYLYQKNHWLLPIFITLIYTGMRRDEVCKMEWSWINFQKDYIKIPLDKTKAGYEKIVPLHIEVKKFFLQGLPYQNRLEKEQDIYQMFCVKENQSQKVFHIHKDTASHAFTKVCQALNLTGISLHSTRATFITKTLKLGDTVAVQSIVGHKDLKTTQGYTQAFEKAKRNVIEKLTFQISKK